MMFTKYSSHKIIFRLFCVVFLVLVGCTAQTTPTSDNIQTKSSYSYAGVSVFNYEELVDRSELIVIGQVTEQGETFNTFRDPVNIHTPDPDKYSIGQIYAFSVEEYLKGSGDKNLYIVNREGILFTGNPAGSTIKDADSNGEVYRFSFEKRYILFLHTCCESAAGYDIPDRTYYSGSAQPWLFEISSSDQNLVIVKSPWYLAENFFPALTLEDMLAIIQNPSVIPDSLIYPSYPSPEDTDGLTWDTPYP